jgi:hypothetical protein
MFEISDLYLIYYDDVLNIEIACILNVSHPGRGGCGDPVNEDAILERIGGKPPGRNRERQLASDTGDGKT